MALPTITFQYNFFCSLEKQFTAHTDNLSPTDHIMIQQYLSYIMTEKGKKREGKEGRQLLTRNYEANKNTFSVPDRSQQDKKQELDWVKKLLKNHFNLWLSTHFNNELNESYWLSANIPISYRIQSEMLNSWLKYWKIGGQCNTMREGQKDRSLKVKEACKVFWDMCQIFI